MLGTLTSLSDNGENRLDNFLNRPVVCIDDNRIVSWTHRRDGTRRVPTITLGQLSDKLVERLHDTTLGEIPLPTPSSFLKRGVEPDFHRCIGHDYRTDVTSSHDYATVPREFPLETKERLPHRWVSRNQRRQTIDLG